jgi:NAD-reducing hydrogenase large subunit
VRKEDSVRNQIIIEPITRIEGHGKVTITLNENGSVEDAKFHVTQVRGFEKFCEGRPYYEMPSLLERICGICPISHSLASATACDAILGVRIPETAKKLRRVLNCGEYIQSHALSFFHLSAPDLVLGMDSDPEKRNIFGLMEKSPQIAKDGIRLRQIGQEIIRGFAGKSIHPSWVVPGGVNEPLSQSHRDQMIGLVPEAYEIIKRTLAWFKPQLEDYREEIRTFANFPTMFMGLVDQEGNLEHLEGKLRIIDSKGRFVKNDIQPENYEEYIGESVENFSYLKSPYYKPVGYPDGIYRVGPAARLNVATGCGYASTNQEWAEFIGLERGPIMSSFHNHYARLIEIFYHIEVLEKLLNDPEIMNTHVRAYARPNYFEGVGIVEAPRGTLIHHYKVDENGLVTWVNLIVATGNNNLAMNKGVLQVAKRWINGDKITDGALNRLEALIRAFDPCLSCSTHVIGSRRIMVQLFGPDGTILDQVI